MQAPPTTTEPSGGSGRETGCQAFHIANQLGRRNLTEDQKSYLRGKRYIAEKEQGKRLDLTSSQNGSKLEPAPGGRTATKLAKEYNVGHNTIKRDAKFAEAVDTLGLAMWAGQ